MYTGCQDDATIISAIVMSLRDAGSDTDSRFMATVVEIVFVGTGTSGAVPNVSCLTEQPPTCKVCVSAMTPEGRKNMKKNTSLIVRFRKHSDPPNARLRYDNSNATKKKEELALNAISGVFVSCSNVLIDCGKTFYGTSVTKCLTRISSERS